MFDTTTENNVISLKPSCVGKSYVRREFHGDTWSRSARETTNFVSKLFSKGDYRHPFCSLSLINPFDSQVRCSQYSGIFQHLLHEFQGLPLPDFPSIFPSTIVAYPMTLFPIGRPLHVFLLDLPQWLPSIFVLPFVLNIFLRFPSMEYLAFLSNTVMQKQFYFGGFLSFRYTPSVCST